MIGLEKVNGLAPTAIQEWLAGALRGREPLPKATPDEPPHLAILRLRHELTSRADTALADGARALLGQFCDHPTSQPDDYAQELVALCSNLRDPETPRRLGDLALRLSDFPRISDDLRFAVLGALVDTPPPRDVAFWRQILGQNPHKDAGMALSGILAVDWRAGVSLLPDLPETESAGRAAAIKLDKTWAYLSAEHRASLVDAVRSILPRCPRVISQPVGDWAGTKPAAAPGNGQSVSLLAEWSPTFIRVVGSRAASARFRCARLGAPREAEGVLVPA